MRPSVAVDFDGVIAATGPLKVDWLRRKLSIAWHNQPTDRSSFLQTLDALIYERMIQEVGYADTMCAEPIESAAEALAEIAHRFDIVVVSSRSREKFDWLAKWLDARNLTRFVSGYVCTNGQEKVRFLADRTYIALIDDDIRHLTSSDVPTLRRLWFGRSGYAYVHDKVLIEPTPTWQEVVYALGLS